MNHRNSMWIEVVFTRILGRAGRGDQAATLSRMIVRTLLGLALTFAAGSAQAGEKYAGVTHLGHGVTLVEKGTYEALSSKYFTGQSADLRHDLAELVKSATFATPAGELVAEKSHQFDLDTNFYSFVFLGKQAAAKDPQVVRVLTYPKRLVEKMPNTEIPLVELGGAVLPGTPTLFEVFLTTDKDASIGSTYTYVETEHPLRAQLLGASKLINPGEIAIGATLDQLVIKVQAVRGPAFVQINDPEAIYFQISRVDLPAGRTAVTAKSATDSGDIAQSRIRELAASAFENVELRYGTISPCAVAIAETASNAVRASTSVSSDPLPDRKTLEDNVKRAIRETHGTAACRGEASLQPEAAAGERIAAVQETVGRFLALTEAPEAKRFEGETTYTNAPPNRWSVGLVAGGLFNAGGDDRVKLADDGVVRIDPVTGSVTMAALYFHPNPYLSGTASQTVAERFRVMFGYVASPEPGLAVGLAYQLFRGLTLNVGYAGLLVDTPADDVMIGTAPTVRRPFRRGFARGVVAGFGYSF